jgi:ureidoglycolate amidohydrolase
MMRLDVDGPRLQAWLDELARFSEVPPPAVTRVLFSAVDLAARAWVRARAVEAGLGVREDAVGNLFARWAGSDAAAPAIASGSHIDAIPNAGRFDGTIGVLGALEAFASLRRAGFRPVRSLELVVFTAEEPTRFGIGCLGSRLLAGALDPARAAALTDGEGRSLEDWRLASGFGDRPLAGVALAPGHYQAFVELHIEQGPSLERDQVSIGIVEAIAGPSSYRVRLLGEGGHAGAVLMPDRHDAGLAGAEIALAVERAALGSGSPDTVGTTGVFRQFPNAVNSVPCDVTLEIDLRDTRLETRAGAWREIEAAIAAICERRGVRWSIETLNADRPAPCDPRLVGILADACAALEVSARPLVSRAYHDALFMAQVCPTAMIFVPCRGGVSHRPDEHVEPAALETGVRVLAHVLARLAS